MTENKFNELQDSGRRFYCPNGHEQIYTNSKQLQIERLEKTIKTIRSNYKESLDYMEHLDRRISALRGVITRMKNKQKGN